MTRPLPLMTWCVGGLVLTLYVCICVSLYLSRANTIHCVDGFQSLDFKQKTPDAESVPNGGTMSDAELKSGTGTKFASKDKVNTEQLSAPKSQSSVSASSPKRPRMIQTLETTSADSADGKNVALNDDDFAKHARWMLMDANYLIKHVIPKHNELMKNTKLFGDGKHKVSAKDKCPAIESTTQLMNKNNAAMYACVEKGLLYVLPQMNQPMTEDATPELTS